MLRSRRAAAAAAAVTNLSATDTLSALAALQQFHYLKAVSAESCHKFAACGTVSRDVALSRISVFCFDGQMAIPFPVLAYVLHAAPSSAPSSAPIVHSKPSLSFCDVSVTWQKHMQQYCVSISC